MPNFAGSWTSLLIALVISAVFVGLSLRRRMTQQGHGVRVEDFNLFAARNGLMVFVLLVFAWQMASFTAASRTCSSSCSSW